MVHLPCTHCSVLMASGNCFECKECKNFQLCDKCFDSEQELEDGERHPINQKDEHILYPSETKEATQDTKDEDEILECEFVDTRREDEERKMLDVLMHASQCRVPNCQYPNCRRIKELFYHSSQCEILVSGGCILCKKTWYLLHLHARTCKESECNIPRCRDLKEHLQQADARHRAAVMRMMRERAKNIGGSW